MRKYICVISIMIFVLTGCDNSIESFSQNEIYNNKEHVELELLALEKKMIINNERSEKYFNKVHDNLKEAKLFEEKLLSYLKDTKTLMHDIDNVDFYTEFGYNVLVYKTQLLVDIENSVKDELVKNAVLNKEEIKKQVTENILNSLKVDYYMGTSILEQSFSYKLKDGSYRVFVLAWSPLLSDTYFYNYKEETLNEEKI